VESIFKVVLVRLGAGLFHCVAGFDAEHAQRLALAVMESLSVLPKQTADCAMTLQ
jgi:hypothetical protein